MRQTTSIIALIGLTLAVAVGHAQTPGSILGLAGQVNGAVTVTSTSPGGCPTRICTTNLVTFTNCFTNIYFKFVCTTNATTGQITCTNVPVTVTRCFTNTFPIITCTNEFLTPPTSLTVRETLMGPLTENMACDEVSALFPSNAVFQAGLLLNLRTNDWAGTHLGFFRILAGTNVLASGSVSGVDGVHAALPAGACGVCNHFEGALHGVVLESGPLHGARLTASYIADLPGVTCPSASVPQGPVVMAIDGVAVIPCPFVFTGF